MKIKLVDTAGSGQLEPPPQKWGVQAGPTQL